MAKKQDSQIGAAKVSGADSTDKNKAVIVGADGKMTLSSSALASGAYSAAYSLPTASSSTLGGVKIGSNVSINSGTISVADASTSAKGVMKVGTDLKVSSGTVSVDKSTSVASGDTKPVTSGAVYNALSNKQDYAGDFITQGSSTDINEDVIGALSDDETFLSGKAVDKAISYKLSSYSQQVVNLEQNKQPLSSANYQMGNSSGGWTTMSAKQQNMLNGYFPATSQTGTAPTGYALIWVE